MRKLETNTDGIFVATLLPPGNYTSRCGYKSGFAEAKATDIEVRVTETTRVTMTLKPGTVSEKVEISAQVTTRRNEQRDDRTVSRDGDGARASAGDTELSAASDAFERRAKRFERGCATWTRRVKLFR